MNKIKQNGGKKQNKRLTKEKQKGNDNEINNN